MAAEIDRAASAMHPDAEEVTVKLAVSAEGTAGPHPQEGWRHHSLRGQQADSPTSRSSGAAAETTPEAGAGMSCKRQRSITWPSLSRS